MFSFDRKLFLFFGQARREEEDKLDFKGGNVHIITTKEGWDQKIAEANRDGKTVSKTQRTLDALYVLDVCYALLICSINYPTQAVYYHAQFETKHLLCVGVAVIRRLKS